MKRLKCRKCGNDKEFYVKERFKGRCLFFFRTDGGESENGEIYQNADHSLVSEFIYCAECDAKVTKLAVGEEISDYESGDCNE